MVGVRILADEIADEVRRLIEEGIYPPGAPLRQQEIAAHLDVSRIPVREAFRLLEADGLVRVEANRGAFVVQPDRAEVAELFDLRLMLEQDLLRRACSKITKPTLERLELLEEHLAITRSVPEWIERDEEFHFTIYAAAERPRTFALARTERRSLNAYYRRFLGPSVRARAWHKEHRTLLRSLLRGDAKGAAVVLERHLRATEEVLVAALDRTHRRQGVVGG